MILAAGDGGDVQGWVTTGGVFVVILWMVRVIVGRWGQSEDHSERVVADVEERFKAELERSISESEKRCEVRLTAIGVKLNMAVEMLGLMAKNHPGDPSIPALLVALRAPETYGETHS